MKRKSKHLFLGILACLAIFHACKVELTEPESQLVSGRLDGDCKFFLTGQVIDGKDGTPIEDANLFSEDLDFDIFSDEEGFYNVPIPSPIEDFFGERQLIEVTKDGYVISTLEIDFNNYYFPTLNCEEIFVEVETDFVLTQIQECQIVDSDGAEFIVYDTTIVKRAFSNQSASPLFDFTELERDTMIREFRVVVPEDALDATSNICITPLHNDQYLGLLEDFNEPVNIFEEEFGSPVIRFDFRKEGLTFDAPIFINFKPIGEEVVIGDDLDFYTLNELTNRWELDNTATVLFNAATNSIQLSVSHFSKGLVLNNSKKISLEAMEISAPQIVAQSEAYNTCNCQESLDIDFSTTIEQIDEQFSIAENNLNEEKILQKLQAVKTLFNISASNAFTNVQYIPFSSFPGLENPTVQIFDERTIHAEGTILKCEFTVIAVALQHRVLRGIFDDQAFSLRSFAGIVVTSPEVDCPTTSLCHQGCPE